METSVNKNVPGARKWKLSLAVWMQRGERAHSNLKNSNFNIELLTISENWNNKKLAKKK